MINLIIGISIIWLAIGQLIQIERTDDIYKWAKEITDEVNKIPIANPKQIVLKERTDTEKIKYFSSKFTEYYAKYHNATLEIKKLEKELRKKK